MATLTVILIIVAILLGLYFLIAKRAEIDPVIAYVRALFKIRLREAAAKRLVKIVVFAPTEYAEAIRDALMLAGAGNRDGVHGESFSVRGLSRSQGESGLPSEYREEERIEAIIDEKHAREAVESVKILRPEGHFAIEVYRLFDLSGRQTAEHHGHA